MLTVSAPLALAAPSVRLEKVVAMRPSSVAVRSSAAVLAEPPTTIACVAVSCCRVRAPVPLTAPFRSISSALMVSAWLPAASVLLKVMALALSVLAAPKVTAPV